MEVGLTKLDPGTLRKARCASQLVLLACGLGLGFAHAHAAMPEGGDLRAPLTSPTPRLTAGAKPAELPAGAPRKTVRYVWRINDGDKISDSFRAWARQASNWQVAWEAPELVAQVSVDLDGSFEEAVTKVIEALNRNDANLLARLYIDKGSNVLRVMEKK